MPVQVSYPGVYIQEIASGTRTITGVSTSITLFIGRTSRGPIDKPTSVLGFLEYQRIFGSDTTLGEMTDQVRQFFLNGGQRAIVARIANGATAAAVSLRDQAGAQTVMTIIAKDRGVDGNMIRIRVDYDTASPESTFNLEIQRLRVNASGVPVVEARERFTNLSMDRTDGRYVAKFVSQNSALVNVVVRKGDDVFPGSDDIVVDDIDAALPPIAGYSLSGLLLDSATDPTAALLALRTPTSNKLQISVDGSPFVLVTLPATAASLSDWEGAINSALNAFGAGVTIDLVGSGPGPALRFLRIRSNKASGGSVIINPAPTEDIAVPLQLGAAQGGIEVSGYAHQRPAPTGFAARLGATSGDPILNALGDFAAAAKSSLTSWTLNDGVAAPYTAAVTFPGVGTMSNGSAIPAAPFVGSLIDLRRNLGVLRDSIAGNTNNQWTAVLHGTRLVLEPKFGDENTGTTATLTSAGGLDIGAANQLFGAAQNVRAYSLGTSGIGNYQTAGTAGSNGTAPVKANYDAIYPVIEREVDLFNLLILPRSAGQTDEQRQALWGPASTFAQSRRAFLLVDPPSDWSDRNDVSNDIVDMRIGVVQDHAAIYWPRLTLSENGLTRPIDPSGSVAGVMARIDGTRGVWKAPAGTEADIRGIRGVQYAISDMENGVINPLAVNAIRVFPNGVVVWGARTMAGYDNSENEDYKYVPVRRLALFLEESLYRGLKFAVFEPNDEPLWGQIRLAVGAFMNNLFRQGAFQGQKASDAYFVKCDAETTTQNDINLGIVNVLVGFAALKPAEFVIITIQQKAGQVQV